MEKNIHQSFVGTINNQSFNNETSYLATLSILSALEEKKQIGLGNNTEFTRNLYEDVHKLVHKYDYDVSSVVESTKDAIELTSSDKTLKDVKLLAFEDDDGKYMTINQKLASGAYDNKLDVNAKTTHSIDQEFWGEINGNGIKHESTYSMAEYFIENIENKKQITIEDQAFTYDLINAIATLQNSGVSQESIETATMDHIDEKMSFEPSISDFKVLSEETDLYIPFNANVEQGVYDYLDHYDELKELAASNDMDIEPLIQYQKYYLQEFGKDFNTSHLPTNFNPEKAPIGVMTYGDIEDIANTYNFSLSVPEEKQDKCYPHIKSLFKDMEYGEEDIYINLKTNQLNDRVNLTSVDNYQDLEYPASQDTYKELKPYYLSNYTDDLYLAQQLLNKQEYRTFKVILVSNLRDNHHKNINQKELKDQKSISEDKGKSNQLIFK